MEYGDSRDRLTLKNVSYLRARDPSILAFNRPALAEVKTNLISELGEETVVPQQKQNDNISIYLRIKNGCPLENLYEISDNTLICNVPPTSNCMRNIKEGDILHKMFSFSKIFRPETTQAEIFNNVVKPKILDFINGQNSTLLTYGASGSGKTFTVIGTDEEPGVVPRSLEYMFRTLPQLSKNPRVKPLPTGDVSILNESDYRKEKIARRNLLNSSSSMDRSQHIRTYTAMQQRLSSEPVATLEDVPDVSLSVWVSFAEIYNEHLYDLLQPDPPRGQQRTKLRLGCSNGHTYIKNLTNISVTSGLEAYQILQYGIHNANYASTCLNSHSSRSHSIFTIKLVQVSDSDGGTYVSIFNFCDLAGCERSKKTMNVGDRLKESNNINTSLLVLGRCISAVRDAQKQNENKLVPFRESKLTQLFQKALAGQEDIAMIVTISPRREMFDETQHVLNFSAVAKEIAIESKPLEKMTKKKSRFSQLAEDRRKKVDDSRELEEVEERDIEELENMVFFLQEELERVRNDCEINQRMEREHMMNSYAKIIEDMRASADRREKELERIIKKQWENKMMKMRAHYEELLSEKKEKEDVILLDDSSEEEEEEEKERLKETVEKLQRKIAEMEKTLTNLRMEHELQGQELQKVKREKFELRETLDEGISDVNEMVKENEMLREELAEWKRRYMMLETEIENNKVFIVNREESDEQEVSDTENEYKFLEPFPERVQETPSVSRPIPPIDMNSLKKPY